MCSQPILSISILISNRVDTVEKCLKSLEPLMQAIPSELIIVNTGSTDGSIDIAKRYTDKIISFPWCNDFAAARNTGLKAANGKWFLFIDDDEWFESTEEIVSFLKQRETGSYERLCYQVRNYHYLGEESTYDEAICHRMSLRTEELRFEGKVHERLVPACGEIKFVNDFVHHYGYAFKNQEEKVKHFNRNMELLKIENEKKPKDTHILLQMAQEYLFMEDFEAADNVVNKGIAVCEEFGEQEHISWFLITKAAFLKKYKKFDELLYFVEKWSDHKLPNRLCRAGLYGDAMMAAFSVNRIGLGIEYGEKYLALADMLIQDKEKLHSSNLLGMANYIELIYYSDVQAYMIEIYARGLRWKDSWEIVKKFRWEALSNNVFIIMEKLYLIADEANAVDELQSVIEKILDRDNSQDTLAWKLVEVTEHEKVPPQLLLEVMKKQNANELDGKPICNVANILFAVELKVDLKKLTANINFSNWVEIANTVGALIRLDKIDLLLKELELQMIHEKNKFTYIKMIFLERYLEFEENYFQHLNEYLFARIEYLETECLDPPLMEKKRAIKIFKEAKECFEAGEVRKAKELLQESVGLYKELESIALVLYEKILNTLKEENNANSLHNNLEFIALAEKLKNTVKDLIRHDKKKEALGMLRELQAMIQNDEEIEDLIKMCL